MKKVVNGKVVDIPNIELFDLAAEGLALQETAVSDTSNGLVGSINPGQVNMYIKQYDAFFKCMPYPLYAIESDIKYATLGNFIKSLSKNEVEMWVDKGLYIRLNQKDGLTLKIVNKTWSICYCTEDREDNTDLTNFKDEVGYKEYSWMLKTIINKDEKASYYKEFMPQFLEACNNQPVVLKWELNNMLTFVGTVPNRMTFVENTILDLDNELQYSLDIYQAGVVETDDRIPVWGISNNGLRNRTRAKTMKTYNYDTYVKDMSEKATTDESKINKTQLVGLNSLFLELCGFKSARDMDRFPTFCGVIDGTNLVFCIENRLYIAKSSRMIEAKEIASGVELYAVESNKIYFTKSKKVNEKVKKSMLYSYSIKDGSFRLCKIMYEY